jgi:PHP family Zn ribbon phosphoesterase
VKRFKADLHIHTALSPCADEAMTPPAIVREAVRKGLTMIAVCDHNTAGNAAAVQTAAVGGLCVIAGMEITTTEDIHVLGLFPDAAAAGLAAATVMQGLPQTGPGAGGFGRQLLMDPQGNVIGEEPRLLIASSRLNLSQTIHLIQTGGGIAIAAHVNKPAFSVASQLGVFPPEAGFDAVELFPRSSGIPNIDLHLPPHTPVLQSSDSHFLADIGSRFTILELCAPSFTELLLGIRGEGSRGCVHA